MTLEQAAFVPTFSTSLSEAEKQELSALGFLDEKGRLLPAPAPWAPPRGPHSVERKAISSTKVLNEAHAYHPTPASFSRGLRVEVKPTTSVLYISGTSAVDDKGRSIHIGDFRAQCWRTFRNITELLRAEGATWQDIVRTSCYLRDIERDYEDFNQVRNYFLRAMDLDPLPASTGIQARLCRSDLLIEIEAIAMLERAPEA
jgi:enamine deaminase RidA (YjgF/YER057c/UK114 family)